MTAAQNINIKLDRGGPENHAWTVLGTLLVCGAIGAVAYVISAAGALDLAATGLAFFFTQLISMMFKSGLLVLPDKKGKDSDFAESATLLRTLWTDFQRFQANSPVWRLAMLAFGSTIGYMIFRWGLALALGIFHNFWIAGAATALLASFIVAPSLFSSIFSKLKSKSGVQIKTNLDEPEPTSGGTEGSGLA